MLGWTADPYLYWVFELYVAGKGSPSKLVQHSGALSDLFGKHVAAMQECPVRNSRINKMKYAKQRFSSTAVPLQRSVLFFEAVWRFLVDVQTVRCGTEPGRHASHFLTNATAESLIQAAMMAEGADEHVQFRRFFDSDRWDATGAGMEIQRFLNNLSHLFIAPPGGQAACLRHGFVKYALDMLRTPHVCWSGGSQHVMGGPGAVTDAIVDRCLSRMANWLRLTVSAASAEFPRWQLVNALDALNLARHCSQQRDADGDMAASTKVNLERLAKAFDLDIHLLTEEFNTCLPGAKKCFRSEGTGASTDAWIHALQNLHRTALARHASPLATLLHVAQCWIGLSTSKVEQTFGKIKSVTSGDTRHCKPESESMEARLCADLRDADAAFKAIVFKEANVIWASLIPRQRAWGKARLGNFARGQTRKLDNSEQGFLRKRRAAVAAASGSVPSSSSGDIYRAAVTAGASTWNASHQAKEGKLETKRNASKYSGDHVLLPQDGLDAGMQTVAKAAMAKAHARFEKAKAKTQAMRKVFKRKYFPKANMPVYLCASTTAEDLDPCLQAITAAQMVRSRDPLEAVYYVTTNPGDPVNEITKLTAGLCGGMLVTPAWLTSMGARGLATMAIPALKVKRKLWISKRFRSAKPAIAQTIDKALASPDSCWAACTKEVFVNGAIKTPPPLNVLGLVTRTEKDDLGVRSAMDLNGLLSLVFKLDPMRASMGTS